MKTVSFIHAKSKLGFLNAAAAGLTFTVAMTPLSLQADAWLYNDPATFIINSPFTAPANAANALASDRITGNTPATVVRVTAGGVLESTMPLSSGFAGFNVATYLYTTIETWRPASPQYGRLEIVNGGIVNSKHSAIGYGRRQLVAEPNVYADAPAHGEVLIGAGSKWSVNGWLMLGVYKTPYDMSVDGTSESTGRLTLEGGDFETTGTVFVDSKGNESASETASVFFGHLLFPELPPRPGTTPVPVKGIHLSGYVELFHSQASSYTNIGTAAGDAGTLSISGKADLYQAGTITLHSNSTYIKTLTSTPLLINSGIRRQNSGGFSSDVHLEIVDGATLDVQLDPGFSLTGAVGETIRVAEYTSYALTEWYGAAPGTGHGFNDGASEITIGGHVYEIQYNATGIDLVIVPEPSTYALLGGIGAVALAVGARWRRRRKG